jgi:hypothetical protein
MKEFLLYGLELSIFISTYTMSYLCDWKYQLSFYGIIMMIYFITQIVCSSLNLRQYKHIAETPKGLSDRLLMLLIVGHRENEEYWKNCLTSVMNLDTNTSLKFYFCKDSIVFYYSP